MAKKKFNSEERRAIIKKLSKIASERAKASWEKHRAAYRPSAEYQRAKMLIAQRNTACKELREMNPNIFLNWTCFEQIRENNFVFFEDNLPEQEKSRTFAPRKRQKYDRYSSSTYPRRSIYSRRYIRGLFARWIPPRERP